MIRKLKDQNYAKIALKEAVALLALESDMTFQSCWNKVQYNADKIYKSRTPTPSHQINKSSLLE